MKPGGVRVRAAAAAASAALRLGNVGLSVVASVVISRSLAPEGRGLYAIAVAVALLAIQAGSLAVQRALHHAWAREHGPGVLAGAAVLAGVGAGTIAAILAGMVVWIWPGLVAPAGPVLVWLALASVPAALTGIHLTVLLSLHGRPEAAAKATLLTTVLQIGFLGSGAASGRLSPTWVVTSWSLAFLLGTGVYLRALPWRLGFSRGTASVAVRLLRWATRYHPATMVTQLLLRVDVLILASLRGAREVGLYSLAVSMSESVVLVTNSVAQAGSGAQARGDGDDRYTARLARTTLSVGLVLAAGLCVTAGVLVPFLFGDAFRPSVVPLLVLLPGAAALAMREPLELAVSRRDRPLPSTVAAVAALAVNVALNLTLIPRWGAAGAGFASATAYVLQLAVVAGWFLRVSGLPARELVPRLDDVTRPLGKVLAPAMAMLPGLGRRVSP